MRTFVIRMLMIMMGIVLSALFGSTAAHADPLTDLMNAAASVQSDVTNAIEQTLPQVSQPVTPPVPAVSIPMEVQRHVDPVFTAGMSAAYGAPLILPEPEQYDPSDPLDVQINDTIGLFVPEVVMPDAGACASSSDDFSDKVACSSAIVDQHNGDVPVAPVTVTKRYTPFVIDSVVEDTPEGPKFRLCGGHYGAVSYCGGHVHFSKPVMNYWSTASGNGDNMPLELVTSVNAHEQQHYADDLAYFAEGRDMRAFGDSGEENLLVLESSADKGAGYILQQAMNNGQLPADALDRSIAFVKVISPDGEPTHGGHDHRESMMRDGAAE